MFDLHAHIIPQVDDGAASWAEAYQMLKIAVDDGITILTATPHFLEGWFTPEPAEIKAGVARLNHYAQQQGWRIQVVPGMEVALSPDIPRLLQENRLLTLNDEGKYLLVELPANNLPLYTESLLFKLQLMGITPILAHPERNRFIADNPDWLTEPIRRGVLVQVTADSLLGRFGKKTREITRKLVLAGAVHGLGSDAHSSRHRPPALRAAVARMSELIGQESSQRLAWAEKVKIGAKSEEFMVNSLLSQTSPPTLCRRLLNTSQHWFKQVIRFK